MERSAHGSSERFHLAASRPPSEARDRDVEGLTILAVDDEPGILSLYRAWCAPRHRIHTAKTGREALTDLDATVDVLILDRTLPDVSGDRVARSLYGRGYDDVAVVVVSAREPELDVVDLPFDVYLTKPVDRETLVKTVEWAHRQHSRPDAVAEFLALDHRVRLLEASAVTVELQSSTAFCRLRDRRADAKRRLMGRGEATTGGQTGEAVLGYLVGE